MRSLLLLALVAATVTGCGSADDGGTLATSPHPATRLTVEVRADATAAPQRWTLTCDPAGGDHPDPAGACAALADDAVVAPLAADRVCTQQYGGPQTATLTGTLRGRPVDLHLGRSNGCTISQWDALGAVLPG